MAVLAISGGKELGRYPLGPYIGVLLGDVESLGSVQYGLVFDVFDPRTGRRVFAVAAERNLLAGTRLGGGAYFLCGYDGESHLNFGSSDDHADRDKFLARAIELVRGHLNLPPEPPQKRAAETDRRGRRPEPDEEEVPGEVVAPGPALGMWLTLAGVMGAAMPMLLHVVSLSLSPQSRGVLATLAFLCYLGGAALFAAGCFITGSRLRSRDVPMLWPAGILAAAALLWSLLKYALHAAAARPGLQPADRVSSQGMFLAALFFHGLFMLTLLHRLGVGFNARPVGMISIAWVVLTGAIFYTTWLNGGLPPWANLAALAAMAVWTIVQLILVGKASSDWGRRRLQE